MATISAEMQQKIHTLSPDLQNRILQSDANIQSLQDLIRVLERIVSE